MIKELRIGNDNICPATNKPCDDECCPPGAICNLSGLDLSPTPSVLEIKQMTPEQDMQIRELKLSLYMLLKVFKKIDKTKEQQMYYDRAQHISNKYHNIKDILRDSSQQTDNK